MEYHDKEWGVPVYDDRKHFEFLTLESAQAGLSWLTILKRREGYRRLYNNFNPHEVASFDEQKVLSMLNDTGIIRNRMKIESSINNAARFLEIVNEYDSFSNYFWHFTDGKQIVNKWKEMKEIPPKTQLSDTLSKDLKSRGFKFVGSTTIYAHLQAAGIVNDHIVDCFRYQEVLFEK
jgi:DNA-3-methyladenine glycosylase I